MTFGVAAEDRIGRFFAAAYGRMMVPRVETIAGQDHRPLLIAPRDELEEEVGASGSRGLTQLGLRRISDGFFRRPILATRGAAWVPQQLWWLKRRGRSPWTVCYHINRWTDADVAAFRRDVARFAAALTDFATVCDGYPASSCHGARLVDASSLPPLLTDLD